MKTLLERHFDTAFDAPDGIKRLRELILSLAMQGKLVKQDPNDPPASELLKEIEAEKKRLIKAGKIKQPKLLLPVKLEKVPYKLPKSWEWVRFGAISQHNSGKTLDKGRNTGELRDYITTSNLYWGRFELTNVRQMPIKDSEIERCIARKNDLLICEGGEAGRAAVWDFASEVCFQNHVHRARFYKNISPYFAFRFFEKLNETGEINQYRQGVGISNMSSKALASIAFPLPPLAEQHRIVAKIDQLMARCDVLEKLRAESDQKRLVVHAAAIRQLLDPASLPSRPQHVQHFLFSHFPELYAVKENVTELRKAILQLAVMGKLVPQDPKDHPASELLKEIEAEKKRLIKAGKIKQPKPLPPIKPEEIPFELPKSWQWVRLGEIVSLLGDGIHGTPKYDEAGDYFFINGNNLNDGVIDFKTNTKRVSFSEFQKHKKELTDKTVLVSINGTIGNVAFYNGEKVLLGKSACYFNLFSQIEKQYIKKMIQCDYFVNHAFGTATGTTIKNVSLKTMREFCVPLPPLAEQHRIVAKVDQLMALCDAMENQITSATHKQTTLLNALLKGL